MKTIWTIFKKEMLDVTRDRRAMVTAILLPLLMFPLIFGVMNAIGDSQEKKAKEKTLRVAIIEHGQSTELPFVLERSKDIRIIKGVLEDSIRSFIRHDSLDAAFVLDAGFLGRYQRQLPGTVRMYYNSAGDINITKRRLRGIIDKFEDKLLDSRFAELQMNRSVTKVLRLEENDVASTQERFGRLAGGFLPYIFVIFCFMGAMYPALDLAAGEKERGTIETLLVSPASRFQILVGKFGVVVLGGLLSALMSILGIYIAFTRFGSGDVPEELVEVLNALLSPQSVIMLMSLLLPLAFFFSAILLGLSIFARSYKEAQSIVSPGMFLVILPAAVGMIPGITLNFITAMVPILNVSLATKEIIAGTIPWGLMAVVYVSQIAIAAGSLWLCSRWFANEANIFRS